MIADDLRPLLLEAEDDVRRARLRPVIPSVATLIVLGGAFAVLGAEPIGLRWTGLGLVSLGALTLTAALRHRRRELPARSGRIDGVRALVLRRRPGAFWAGMAVLGVVAGVPVWIGSVALAEGRAGAAVVAGLVAVGLAWPLVVAALGRYVPGDVVLTAAGVRYRHLGLESWTPWEAIGVVAVHEPYRRVDLHALAGSTVRHRYRAWPRGQLKPADTVVVLELKDWGALATDVGRLVLHYAEHPADRAELGTGAAPDRWSRLLDKPILRRVERWHVGERDRVSEPDPHEGGWAPLWADSAGEATQRSLQATYTERLRLVPGLVLAGPTTAALAQLPPPINLLSGLAFTTATATALVLAFVDPRPPGLAAVVAPDVPPVPGPGVVLRRSPVRLRMWAVVSLALAVGTAVPLLFAALALPAWVAVLGLIVVLGLLVLPVLVVTGAVVPRELRMDEAGLTYRSHLTRHEVAWHEIDRADTVRDDVVRLGLRDGRVVRMDLGGTGGRGLDVALVASRYAEQGGPRGQTRDVEAVRRVMQGYQGR